MNASATPPSNVTSRPKTSERRKGPSQNPPPSSQTSRDSSGPNQRPSGHPKAASLNSPSLSRTSGSTTRPSHHSKNPSRNALPSSVVEIDSDEGSGDDAIAPPRPRLVSPLPIPSLEGRGGHIFAIPSSSTPNTVSPLPIPSLEGRGGHIFPTPSSSTPSTGNRGIRGPPNQRPTPHNTSVGPPTNTLRTDLKRYESNIRFRHTDRVCTRHIHVSDDDDIGDGNSWYYVTVGRTVGIFNTW